MTKPAPSESTFEFLLPWTITKTKMDLIVTDAGMREVCRVARDAPYAEEITNILRATPWLLTAVLRMVREFSAADVMSPAIQQWMTYGTGKARHDELMHALDVVTDPTKANQPPESFSIKFSTQDAPFDPAVLKALIAAEGR